MYILLVALFVRTYRRFDEWAGLIVVNGKLNNMHTCRNCKLIGVFHNQESA